MAKDHSNKSFARTSYDKISKLTFGFSRRTSPNPKTNIPNPSPPTMNPHPPVPGEMITAPKPESFSPHEAKPTKRFVRFSSSNIKKTGGGGGKELSANNTFSEEKYNSYIDNTKKKMRAPSNVSAERTVSRRESFNDMFSSYINRTKLRLRTTSSVDPSK
ncbi:hypothetical protein HanRHA438_Chr10g0437331 [Helianthus annuus]|nr:hypothetical protein HanIR_Chr10g0458091 [Helianthus annuus]KAJ0878231.1 hypothetical protein HanRHA438_Chr10g0437331 [Helianthus annuus]